MRICPRCSAGIENPDRFCRQCGFFLPHSEPVKEHRLVTVVFSDMSGYSILSEKLEPEDLKVIMDAVLVESTRIITGHGGVVEKFIGDAVVAMFGLHQTREDDPVQAVRAALRIHEFVREMDGFAGKGGLEKLEMHSGINTGEVLLDRSGSSQSVQGPLGRPISIAARLSDMAEPGEILIGESLVSQALRYFHLDWAGRKIIKGFRSPMHVHRVISERKTPLPLHREGGVVSPMVGRDHELSVLWAKAKDLCGGYGGIVYITGDAGSGKSRLIREFRASLDGDSSFISAWCFDHTKDSPYSPILEIVRQILKIDKTGQPTVDAGVLFYKMEKLGVEQDHREILSFLCGCPLSHDQYPPDKLKAKVCDAFVSLLAAASKVQSTIFCMEDIHWADRSTLDLLVYISHVWKASPPCMFILTSRAEPGETLSGTHIVLQELSEEQAARMLALMLDMKTVPISTVKALHEATGGNPFYLEEVVNYLLEKGVDPGSPSGGRICDDLPATIQGLIGSRIDILSARSRRMLQEAALIGRTFSTDLLDAVSSIKDGAGLSLQDLMEHGFIIRMADRQYQFKHDLTREVASRALLRKDRASMHLKIALEMEKMCFASLRGHPDAIAYHFEEAGEYARAVDYRIKAARLYQETGSWFEAAANYLSAEKTFLAHPGIPGARARLREIREGIWLCSRIFNPALAVDALESLVSHYRSEQLKKEEAYACVRLINLYSQKGLFDKALHLYENTALLVSDEPVLLAALHTVIAYTYTFLGRPLLALEFLDRARPVIEKSSDLFLLAVNCLTTLAALIWKGDIREACSWYTKTKESVGDHMDLDLMADIWLSHICCLKGDFRTAKKVYREVFHNEKKLGQCAGGLSYLRIQGAVYFRARYLGDTAGARRELGTFDNLSTGIQNAGSLVELYQAWIALEEGEASLARDLIKSSLPGLKDGVANRVPYALNALAEAYLSMGELDEAGKTALEAVHWNEINGNQDQLVWSLRISAQVAAAAGDFDAARRALNRSFRIARTLGMRPHKAWILAAWGDALLKSGEFRKALVSYRKSFAHWEEMGNQYQAGKMKKILTCLED